MSCLSNVAGGKFGAAIQLATLRPFCQALFRFGTRAAEKGVARAAADSL